MRTSVLVKSGARVVGVQRLVRFVRDRQEVGFLALEKRRHFPDESYHIRQSAFANMRSMAWLPRQIISNGGEAVCCKKKKSVTRYLSTLHMLRLTYGSVFDANAGTFGSSHSRIKHCARVYEQRGQEAGVCHYHNHSKHPTEVNEHG
jgi:hypothetical protein